MLKHFEFTIHLIKKNKPPFTISQSPNIQFLIFRLKICRENLISKKNKLDTQSQEFLAQAKEQKRLGRKVECHYFLKKKRLNDALNKNLTNKVTMVDQQINNINTLQDDIEFAEVLKDSNKVLNEMKEENALETLEETMDLLQSSDMYQSKIKGLLEEFGAENIDEDISKEYQFLDTEEINEINDNVGDLNTFDEVEDKKKPEIMLS